MQPGSDNEELLWKTESVWWNKTSTPKECTNLDNALRSMVNIIGVNKSWFFFFNPLLPVPRALKPLICFIGKMSYLAGGMAISIRGQQASRKEAPILVIAPHSSFLDSCIVYATKMSSVIVRKESMDNYVGSMFFLSSLWEVPLGWGYVDCGSNLFCW